MLALLALLRLAGVLSAATAGRCPTYHVQGCLLHFMCSAASGCFLRLATRSRPPARLVPALEQPARIGVDEQR